VVAAVVFLAMFDEGRYQADTAVIETEDTAA
jgi:hypothetical protein